MCKHEVPVVRRSLWDEGGTPSCFLQQSAGCSSKVLCEPMLLPLKQGLESVDLALQFLLTETTLHVSYTSCYPASIYPAQVCLLEVPLCVE